MADVAEIIRDVARISDSSTFFSLSDAKHTHSRPCVNKIWKQRRAVFAHAHAHATTSGSLVGPLPISTNTSSSRLCRITQISTRLSAMRTNFWAIQSIALRCECGLETCRRPSSRRTKNFAARIHVFLSVSRWFGFVCLSRLDATICFSRQAINLANTFFCFRFSQPMRCECVRAKR